MALTCLFFSFPTVVGAHNSSTIVSPAQTDTCQYSFVEPGREVGDLVDQRNAVKKTVLDKIYERTSLMVQEDGKLRPVLLRDKAGPGGGMTTDLAVGMNQLFAHEILSNASDKLHTAMQTLAAKWADGRRRFIEAQFKEYTARRQQELRVARETKLEPGAGNETLIPKPDPETGFFQTAYIVDHMDFLKRVLSEEEVLKAGTLEGFKAKALKQQEFQLKKYLLDRTASLSEKVSSELRELKRNNQRAANEEGKILIRQIADDYDSGVTTNLDIPRFHSFLLGKFEAFKVDLQARFPLPAEYLEEGELKKAFELPAHFDESVTLNASQQFQISLPQGKAMGTFYQDIAAIGVYLDPPTSQADWSMRTAMVVNLHGCGTNKSTAASFLRLQPVAAKCGYHSVAYNLPGAAGEDGVGLNSIRKYLEMAAYMEMLNGHAQTLSLKPNMPLVVYGRSMGSTQTFANLIAAQQLGYTPQADVSLMMSFSNPNTLDEQIKNVFAQRDRGDIMGIRDDALEHSMRFANDLQAHVPHLPADRVSLKNRQLQVTFAFIQGLGDEDGVIPGSEIDIGEELKEYRDHHSPYSPVYIFEDPLAKYKVDGVIEGVNSGILEAAHFLASARDDMMGAEPGSFFSSIPRHLWPQLGSQTRELYGIPWAMLDYLISHCPYTHPEQRERLRKTRFEVTGSNRPFAYLERYVATTINAKVAEGDRKTLYEIVADPFILPHRDSGIYGRMKKLHHWVLAEAKRVSELAPIPDEDPHTPIVRLWESAKP